MGVSAINNYETPDSTKRPVVHEDLVKLVNQMMLGDIGRFTNAAHRTATFGTLGISPSPGMMSHLFDTGLYYTYSLSGVWQPIDVVKTDWTDYSSSLAWTSTGVAPAFGNAVRSSIYRETTGNVDFDFSVIHGTTSSYGTGIWIYSLPITAHSGEVDRAVGSAWVLDAGTIRRCATVQLASTTTVRLVSDAGDVGASVPFAWGNTDALAAGIRYRPA